MINKTQKQQKRKTSTVLQYIIEFTIFFITVTIFSFLLGILPPWACLIIKLGLIYVVFEFFYSKYLMLSQKVDTSVNISKEAKHAVFGVNDRVKNLKQILTQHSSSMKSIGQKVGTIGKQISKVNRPTLKFDSTESIETQVNKYLQAFVESINSNELGCVLDKTAKAAIANNVKEQIIDAVLMQRKLLSDSLIHKEYWTIENEGTRYEFKREVGEQDGCIPFLWEGFIEREESGNYIATLISTQLEFNRHDLASNEPYVEQFSDYNLARCKRWVEIRAGLE